MVLKPIQSDDGAGAWLEVGINQISISTGFEAVAVSGTAVGAAVGGTAVGATDEEDDDAGAAEEDDATDDAAAEDELDDAGGGGALVGSTVGEAQAVSATMASTTKAIKINRFFLLIQLLLEFMRV